MTFKCNDDVMPAGVTVYEGEKEEMYCFLNLYIGGRVAKWLGRYHRLSRAVLRAGLWARVPSPLGRAALPTTTGAIDDLL